MKGAECASYYAALSSAGLRMCWGNTSAFRLYLHMRIVSCRLPLHSLSF